MPGLSGRIAPIGTSDPARNCLDADPRVRIVAFGRPRGDARKAAWLPVVQSGRMGDKDADKALFSGLVLMGLVALLVVVALALVVVLGISG